MAFKDLTGVRFGRLVVRERTANKITKNGKPVAQWLCDCDCGNTAIVRTASLNNGCTKSCGCLRSETATATAKSKNVVHGLSHTRIYGIWAKMLCRCSCETNKDYANYGARGIGVCDEWKDFGAFYNWAIINGYEESLSIDRKDNDKGYSPDNCRWATAREQANNTRQNANLTYDGETKTIVQWADQLGLPATRLYKRRQYGFVPEQILSTDSLKGGGKLLKSNFL